MKKKKRSATKVSSKKAPVRARRRVAHSARSSRSAKVARSTRAARTKGTARPARRLRPVRAPRRRAPARPASVSLKVRTKPVVKVAVQPALAMPAPKATRKMQRGAMQKALSRMAARSAAVPRPTPAPKPRSTHRLEASRPARPATPVRNVNRQLLRAAGAQQFNYMRAPGSDTGFEVGDPVEVFCDHERDGERIRGWIKGVVVQVDNKLVAVQFRTNVFLTDGWMVPDRILWYSLTSDQIRAANFSKKAVHRPIPEY